MGRAAQIHPAALDQQSACEAAASRSPTAPYSRPQQLSDAPSIPSAMQGEQQDVYGFPLEGLSAQQRADRAACAAYEGRRRAKWQAFVTRQELPTGSTLKRYCRKVGRVGACVSSGSSV